MHAKHDKIRRLKQELKQLETWYEMGLVPPSHVPAHLQETHDIKIKIDEENHKLQMLKEEQGMTDSKPSRYIMQSNQDHDGISISEVGDGDSESIGYGSEMNEDVDMDDHFGINDPFNFDSEEIGYDDQDDDMILENEPDDDVMPGDDVFRWGKDMLYDDEESFD